MRRPLLLFISWLCFLGATGQDFQMRTERFPLDSIEQDTLMADSLTTAEPERPPKEKQVFLQVSAKADYGKLGSTLLGIDEKFEGGAMLLFYNQFYIEGEYGVATLTPENAFRNGVYRSEGSYFRAGAGYLKQLDAKSRLGFGVMYAQSQFEDEGRVFSKSPSGVQSDFDKVFGGTGLSAEWVELVITSESRLSLLKGKPESKLNRLLALGFNFRLRFLQTYDSREPTEDVYAIPGYGRIVNNPNPALNLYLKVYLF